MKRWIAAFLMVLLLAQALPVEALASVGKVISKDEYARAYALTGLGTGGLAANGGTYHKGMLPNAHWNASQLDDWLEEKLDTNVRSITDILSGANYTLADLQASDPERYRQYATDGSYKAAQKLYVRAEELREELRLLSQRLEDDSNTIAQMGMLLEEGGDALFKSDQVRYSARIEAAARDIEEIRDTVVDNAEAWEKEIDYLERHIKYGPAGDELGEERETWCGEWLQQLSLDASGEMTVNTVPVSTVNPSMSRLSRLSGNAGLSANDADATITVITENQVAISLIAGENLERVPVKNAEVWVRDMMDPSSTETRYYSSEETGVVVLPVSGFSTDKFGVLHLSVRVDPTKQGYQDYAIDDLDMEKGEIFTHVLTPLADKSNGGAANAVQQPYIYKMELNGKDIMESEFEMTYSEVNDYPFDITVEVRNPDNVQVPDLVMTYYVSDGGIAGDSYVSVVKKVATATKHEGNVYTFTGAWKSLFSPFASKEQRPTFSFGENAGAELTFPSKLVSKKSATQNPINEGTGGGGGVFGQVLGKGFGMTFKIPVIDVNFSLNVPFADYLPKLNIDPGGYVCIYLGSPVLEDKVKDAKLNWQSKDQRAYSQVQKFVEQEGTINNYKAQYNLAKDFYKEKKLKMMASSTINFGIFALATGRWQLDETIPDVKSTEVSLQTGVGMTATYSFSWTVSYPIGPVPVAVTFTIGVSAGFCMQFMFSFAWVNGGFQNWTFVPYKNLTISVSVSVSAQLGIGIKGFLEAWVKLTASLNVMIVLSIFGSDPAHVNVNFGLTLGVGVTVFWVDISKMWNLVEIQIYPTNGNSLLQKYMYEDKENDGETTQAQSGEPDDYPDLAVEATAIQEDVDNGKASLKVAAVGGDPYMFYIAPATGANGQTHQRVRWVNVKTGKSDSVQAHIDAESDTFYEILTRDDYAFDVYGDSYFIYLVAMSAQNFDENGYPQPNTGFINAYCYYMVLERTSDGGLTYKLSYTITNSGKNTFIGTTVARQWNSTYQSEYSSYSTATNPHISYATATGRNSDSKTIKRFDIYGELSTVPTAADQPPVGGTVFGFQNTESYYGNSTYFFTDKIVQNGAGDDYERVQICSMMMGTYTLHANTEDYGASFIGLNKPKNGAAGNSKIDLFNIYMNDGVNRKDRKSIVLEEGDIDYIRVVMGQRDDGWTATVFYTMKETNDEGLARNRLHGLFIEPIQRGVDRKMNIKLTRYEYDMTLPTNRFDVVYLGETPYLYWPAASGDPDELVDDPTNWRVWAVAYDPLTGVMASPSVFAQFKIPLKTGYGEDGTWINYSSAPNSLLLTTSGTGYMITVPSTQIFPEPGEEQDGDNMPDTMSLFSFPERLTPSANITAAVPQQLAIKPGDFEDICLGVMNDGNLGLATFDVSMYEVVNGVEQSGSVGVVHVNGVEPEKSKLTLPDSSVELTGEKAAYREDDFDYASRQYDWVLDHVTQRYNIDLNTDGIVVSSIDTIEGSNPQYVRSSVLMPGSLGTYTAVYKIPDNWEGDKNLRLRITAVDVDSNWVHVMANAAGARNDGIVSNEAKNARLHYELNRKTGKLELVLPNDASNAVKNAVSNGMIANEIATAPADVLVTVQDFTIKHRVYDGYDGQRWLDIVVRNLAASRQKFKLTCAVFLDGSSEATYVNLPYYEGATASRRTQTISLPVNALVDDPAKHHLARVVIGVVGEDERAYTDNEFDLTFDGSDPLRFTKQPEDAAVQEGEDVSFEVGVTGGVKPYSCQWQVYNPEKKRWVDIPGYVEPAMARENIEKKWDGARFRCVVTDAAGTQITSLEVTLTVRDKVSTGDDSNLPLYLAVALLAIIALWLLRRRRRAV